VTGTLAFVFVIVAIICVVAGVTAVARTRRATRADEDEYGVDDETTYAEEAAAVAAAQKAAAEAAAQLFMADFGASRQISRRHWRQRARLDRLRENIAGALDRLLDSWRHR